MRGAKAWRRLPGPAAQERPACSWRKAGGKKVQCGWLKDKYGVSWQIVPTVLGELLSDKDAAKSQRVMQAMLKMVKLDIRKLKQAYASR